MKRLRSTTSTIESRTQIRGLRQLIRKGGLTDLEEKVIRMRYGISESDSAPLQFRGQSNPETRVKLAMMEQEFLSETRDVDPERKAKKDRLIEKLQNL